MIRAIRSRLKSTTPTRSLNRFAERQLASNDCGLAICKAALNICGISVPRHVLRDSLSFDEEGSSFEDMKRTLTASGVRCEYRVIEPGSLSLEGLARMLPCVVMVGSGSRNHYLLLHSVTRTGVNVLDPQKGHFEEKSIRYLREHLSRVVSSTNEEVTLAYVRHYVSSRCAAIGLAYDDRKPRSQLVMDYNKVIYWESLQERFGMAGRKEGASYLAELFASTDDSVVPSRYKTFRVDADAIAAKTPIGLAFSQSAAAPITGTAPIGDEAAPNSGDSVMKLLIEMLRVPEQRGNLKKLLYVGTIASLAALLIVHTNQILIDEVIPATEMSTLYAFVSLLLLIRGFELALNLMKSYVQVILGTTMDGWLCDNLHRKILHSTFESITSYSRAEISLRLNDLLRIKSVVAVFLNDYVFSYIIMVLALLMAAYISLKVSFVILCVSACYTFILKRSVHYIKSLESRRFMEKSSIVNALINIVEGHNVIAKNACEAAFLDDQKIRVEKFLRVQFQSMLASQLLVYIPRFVAILGSLVVIVISARSHIIDQELSLGQIFTLIALAEMCFLSMRKILQTRIALQEQAVVVDRYFDLLSIEQRPPVERDQANVHSISVKDLSYQYPASPFTIRCGNLRLKGGDRVVISGANGSGKSTFLKVVSGLMQKNVTGTIDFHAHDGSALSLEQGFSRVALVRAEDKIFSETIGFNVTLSNERGGQKIYEYAKKVGADDFISPNRHPLSSIIHDQGNNLSTGQRRKLLILRVLFSRADVIIFDEIFRGIDSESKVRIIDTINGLSANKIILFTTHEDLGDLRINRRLEISEGRVTELHVAPTTPDEAYA